MTAIGHFIAQTGSNQIVTVLSFINDVILLEAWSTFDPHYLVM